ncbi:MAG: hypothetical protein LBB56_02965 [Chitinispirillales bacterium]|jgi:hypothetical protein|nr:hypothetical protein [Chitinispirillales bacterium]
MAKKIQNDNIKFDDVILIDTETLAALLSVSVTWIQDNRNRIAGRQKLGTMWRYNLPVIRKRLASGKDILEE